MTSEHMFERTGLRRIKFWYIGKVNSCSSIESGLKRIVGGYYANRTDNN